MALSQGFEALAHKLQEASAMMHSDVRKRLSDAVDAAHKGSGQYAYYLDHSGSGKSGKVVYAKNGDTMMAPYSLADTESGQSAKVDVKNEKKVVPTVTYADPDGDNDSKEAEAIDITGDVVPLREGAVGQDGSAYVKLIQPGWGSSGYYPAEVLKRDGPNVFKAGTKGFWDHATDAQEAARPEGSLRDLASVLTENAHYEENGPAGPGLYAKAKVFEEFRQPVDDLAKHIGVSIRAAGVAKPGKAEGRSGQIIEKLTNGLSVDYVTQAGAGGKVLQLFEAARKRETPAPIPAAPKPATGEESMTEAEQAQVKALETSALESKLIIRKFRERFALADAAGVVAAYFSTVHVAEGLRKRVSDRILSGTVPLTEAGDLDKEKLTKIVEAETKDEAAYISSLSGGKIVTGMGTTQAAEPTEAQKTEALKVRETETKRSASGFGLKTETGKRIFLEGRAAFDPDFNAADGKEVA